MADPVSWLLIEPGWNVVTADGENAGHVEAVTGDSSADIFDGLAIGSSAFARPRYVPAEQVAGITEGTVRLSLDRAGVDALTEFDEPADSIEIEPEKASFVGRAETDLMGGDPQEHRATFVRRVLSFFGLAGRR